MPSTDPVSSITNCYLIPHSVLYWPSTQLHHLVTHSWANWPTGSSLSVFFHSTFSLYMFHLTHTYIYPIGTRQVEDSKIVLCCSLHLIWWWWWLENREVQVLCDIILFLFYLKCIFSDTEFMASSHLTTCFAFNILPGESNFFNNNFSHLIPRMTNHQGDESTLILDFDIANSAQTEYCSTFHFPSVPPWPLGPLGPMDHMDNLDILHHLDHSHRSNHFDNPDWSMINQEDNCRIRIVYLVLF